MKKFLFSLLLVPLLAQAQDVALPFFAADPVAAASADALPQSTNITMYWDSESSPQGKIVVWEDLTNSVAISAVNSNTSYMYNTPDGMIFSSAVMGNSGQAKIFPSGKSLGTNWSVWFTVKREDQWNTKKIMFQSGNAELMCDNGWDYFWNMASPMHVTTTSNHFLGRWTDILVTQTNNATYAAYYDGVYMTNQPRSVESGLRDFAVPHYAIPNPQRIGQIVIWTNTVLLAADALTLHQRMTNTMVDTPAISNALPSFITSGTGLRHAYRSAGKRGRVSETWTDSFTGANSMSMRIPYATLPDYQIVASDRGMRYYSPDAGLMPNNGWTGGSAVFPSPNYTMFITFTPETIGYSTQGYIFITYGGAEFRIDNPECRFKQSSGTYMSDTLSYNQTHTLMSVRTAGGTSNYVDGVYANNTAANFAGETIQAFATLQFSPYNTWNGNLNGYMGEFILCTNTFSTNDAATYHQYATNQYGYDYNNITNTTSVATNQYGYYYMPCASSNLWKSQLTINTFYNVPMSGGTGGWVTQRIKNTNPAETRIKNVRLNAGEWLGADCTVNAYIARTNYLGGATRPSFVSLAQGQSSTNTLPASSGAAWYNFVFDAANTPIIPANTDFYIVFQGTGGTLSVQAYNDGAGNTYENFDYSLSGSTDYTVYDAAFELYTCP